MSDVNDTISNTYNNDSNNVRYIEQKDVDNYIKEIKDNREMIDKYTKTISDLGVSINLMNEKLNNDKNKSEDEQHGFYY